ncbi:MAG: lactate utilization protein [Thermodesulfobacteriota bacterium]
MDNPLDTFRSGRLRQAARALEQNNFEVHLAADAEAAKTLVLDTLIPGLVKDYGAKSASFGGSMTLVHTGIYEAVKACPELRVLDTYDTSQPQYERIQLRRQALLTDIFLTSSNAVTADGKLANLDGTGNRVAAITFGPRHVIVVAGRNKIAPDLNAAMYRIRDVAAPVNAMRLDRKTPCAKTLRCEDCSSPDRICNSWVITEKSYPKGRIKVVLVNADLGF